ncbi:O-antigen polysaccharide polymerase Wzy [Neiella sp. HB171785]|uniref:O-antigen polysaccharide polymerase Wzy n=1 Tax=Neiella litorisoli TaxID=2771431 RepID=A0A8J6UGP5_9GAMM|nr:O-antigen polysaccharide polymerase Wzy [Neiella litorisoli]MBD1390511.1 O-antigen polysaccharide polymerase Wzy [Neiella litorisoli]
MARIEVNDQSRQLLAGLVLATISVLVFASYFDVFETSRADLEVITNFNWLVTAFIIANTVPKGVWSISFIFFIAFGVFHGGLILASGMGGITDEDILYQISFWFSSEETYNAIHLINLSFLALGIGVVVCTKPQQLAGPLNTTEYQKKLFDIGGLMVSAVVVLFFMVAIATGAIASYGSYLSVVDSTPIVGLLFTYIYLFIGLGMVLLTVCYDKSFGNRYFVVFAIWALVAFKLGLRGEVMFPSAVGACMLGRKCKPMNGALLVLAIIVFLISAGIVKNLRVSGDYSGSQEMSMNPLNAVAEMGSSLRAVDEVIRWRRSGDELLMGASYWAPIERQLALLIPQMERLPAAEDHRLLNVKVIERTGPIGFSPVAEAYINFGESGVFILFVLFGAVLAMLDNLRSTLVGDVLLGVSLLPLFVMIRNSFAHVPVQIILGVVVTGALMIMFRKNSKGAL